MSRFRVRDFLDRPDQERIRSDLALFFGPRAAAYMRPYEKMKARADCGGRPWVLSWSWPALFFPYVWLFYRKMYGLGALVVLLSFMMKLLVKESVASLAFCSATMGLIFHRPQ